MLFPRIFFALYAVTRLDYVGGSCPNACSWHGMCTEVGRCNCFSGWEGNDCRVRSCPKGNSIADIPHAKDSAHVLEECSGRGTCERETGNCICDVGWSGHNCGKSSCLNGCSGHGQCISLSVAASTFDGYMYNHTTTYSLWDSNMFWGCKCDAGYSGADCSERICEHGVDPRVASGTSHEVVTLVCKSITATVGGKFKLRYLGEPTKSWLYPTSKAWEVAKALSVTYGSSSLYSFEPVVAYNQTVNDAVCSTIAGQVRKTRIKFRRQAGDLPSIGFYANLVPASTGEMYFETTQTLICDCTARACNGTFRVSFDGEISHRLSTYANGSEVMVALKNMNTIKTSGVLRIKTGRNISVSETTAICRPGSVTNHTYIFNAQTGNIPRIGLLSSVVGYKTPSTFSSTNTTILTLKTYDGRDEDVKICNGVGKCDFATGICSCPAGYGLDPDRGPCGKITPKSSKFSGVARCPGLVSVSGSSYDGTKLDLSQKSSHSPRVYLSMNPSNATIQLSYVVYYEGADGLWIDQTKQTFLFHMTSGVSAGPLILDQAKERIFFVDANVASPFVGIATVSSAFDKLNPYTIWIRPKCSIFGLAFNANFNQRVLFWTCPGTQKVADGGVYFAYVDDTQGSIHNLGVSSPDPMGIAFNYLDSKVYWLDHNLDQPSARNVINSCKTDGTNFAQTTLPSMIRHHTLSLTLTDLLIDIDNNNTAIFIDSTGSSSAVLAVTLNQQFRNNITGDANVDIFADMATSRVLSNATNTFSSPRYLAIDVSNQHVVWTDTVLKKVSFAIISTYEQAETQNFSSIMYDERDRAAVYENQPPSFPVGIIIDDELSPVSFGGVLECYGNGRCLGVEGNFECECYEGFFGDCQARTCPKGRAWFHQPFVDDIAHDVFMECSNAGRCNRETGACACQEGYEGAACERLMCPGQTENAHYCGGNGRCLSMRDLGLKHKDAYLDSDPVTYGSKPRNPLTWDADMIFGCHGAEYGFFPGTSSNITGYSGAKSHLRECPFGFDPRDLEVISSNRTRNIVLYQNNMTAPAYRMEMQQFTCTGTGGSFTINFRGAVSASIAYSATAPAFVSALTALPTIGNVTILMSSGSVANRICAQSGNVGTISFTTELGLTPLLEVSSNALTLNSGASAGQITFSRQAAGKGVLFECSGNGNCNRNTGVCECFDGYGSSDGYGNFGIRGDCGRNVVN